MILCTDLRICYEFCSHCARLIIGFLYSQEQQNRKVGYMCGRQRGCSVLTRHDGDWRSFVRELNKCRIEPKSFSIWTTDYIDDRQLRVGGEVFAMAKYRQRHIHRFDQTIIRTIMDKSLDYSPVQLRDFPTEQEVVEAIKSFNEMVS